MSLNEEQRNLVDQLVKDCVNDPEFMTEVTQRTEKARNTVFDMMASGIPLEDSLGIVKSAITNSALEDMGKSE